ncbi:MAG: hypothetical protein H7Y33_05400 [Cytophagales bacterium]|nr:hypothetical protein [Rhizobacter sp.]
MNTAEVIALCKMVKAFCPSQQFDQYTPDAWALLLGDQPFDDARAAIIEIGRRPLEPGKSNYIEPGHIIGGIKRIRAKRLEATPIPAPPAALETPAEQIAWQRHAREQIAAGTFVAQPVGDVGTPKPRAIGGLLTGTGTVLLDQVGCVIDCRPSQDALEAERSRQLAALEALTATNEETQQ